MLKNLLLTISFVLSGLMLQAQSWEVGAFAGASGYMGDINPREFYRYTDLAYGAQVKRNFDGYWSAKLNLMHGNIWASDAETTSAYQKQRDLAFYSPLSEASLQVEFNFFDYTAGMSRTRITPYLFTGIGGIIFNPQRRINDGSTITNYELKDYLTEGQEKPYQTMALSIPYGIGVKYNFKGFWSLIAEVGYRTAFTDYLDDVSKNYPTDLAAITGVRRSLSDPSYDDTLAGVQRGDYRKTDTYMFAGLSLTFTFVSRNCPVAR
ncbi:MAG: DUF6089 family protein [Sphingobacteriaceae bacterium]